MKSLHTSFGGVKVFVAANINIHRKGDRSARSRDVSENISTNF
jgi:hypothetical protein